MALRVLYGRPLKKATAMRTSIQLPAGSALLRADVSVPPDATGFVLFAHGSGSSRLSPRNRSVAEFLNQGRIGTILVDLLTESEESADRRTAELRFDIGFLAGRLAAITDWTGRQDMFGGLNLGYFGASTGAAAALVAAASRPERIRAVVSRGGRPDLAGASLSRVTAPCLFLVGGNDPVVLRLNREAIALLPQATARRLEIVPGATHLFEEPGTLELVATLARQWFQEYL